MNKRRLSFSLLLLFSTLLLSNAPPYNKASVKEHKSTISTKKTKKLYERAYRLNFLGNYKKARLANERLLKYLDQDKWHINAASFIAH